MDYTQLPLFDWLSQTRRDFHKHPEIGFKEVRTTSRIKEILTELGIGFQELSGMETGAVGLVKGQPGEKTLALRADIYALPIKELNDVPYKSTVEGMMHACGHDTHTTFMLGVAKNAVESNLKDKIKGNLKFVFQPAEERVPGANKMIDTGFNVAFTSGVHYDIESTGSLKSKFSDGEGSNLGVLGRLPDEDHR